MCGMWEITMPLAQQGSKNFLWALNYWVYNVYNGTEHCCSETVEHIELHVMQPIFIMDKARTASKRPLGLSSADLAFAKGLILYLDHVVSLHLPKILTVQKWHLRSNGMDPQILAVLGQAMKIGPIDKLRESWYLGRHDYFDRSPGHQYGNRILW